MFARRMSLHCECFVGLFMKKQHKTSPYPLIHFIIATEGALRKKRSQLVCLFKMRNAVLLDV